MNESHDEVVMAEMVDVPPKKSILEQILHPESIQRMMQFGGVVLVLGCALWLWSIGIFDHPIVAALALGVTNLIVLASGCLLINKSRYELAGRGLTLLGALALPLNLWFYDAQELVTLAKGGHLWIPAAAICFIYALVARVLKRPSFAYAFVGGVHLTGLLFLADHTVGLFWNWMPAATLFVFVGWACMFAKGLFPKEGDFSQDQFGVAFYRAGLLSVVVGLGLVFWSQWCDFFQPIISFFAGDVVAPTVSERLWAAGLVLLSMFGFAGEYLIAGRRNRDAGLATGLLLWGILSLFSAFDIVLTLPIVAFVLVAVVVARFATRLKTTGDVEFGEETANEAAVEKRRDDMQDWWLGAGLIGLALTQFLTQFPPIGGQLVFAPIGWLVVAQMVATAVGLWLVGLRFWGQSDQSGFCAASTAAATFASISLALAVGSAAVESSSINAMAAVGFLGPLVCVVVMFALRFDESRGESRSNARMLRGVSSGIVFSIAALATTLFFMAAGGMFQAVEFIHVAWMLAASAVLLFASGYGPARWVSHSLGAVCTVVSVGCLFAASGLGFDYSIIFAFVLAGAMGGVAAEVLRRSGKAAEFCRSIEIPANIVLLIGSVTGILLSWSRLIDQSVDFEVLFLGVVQLACVVAGLLATRNVSWRLALRAAAIGTLVSLCANITTFLQVSPIHRVELGSLVAGVISLVYGHIAWSREADQADELATSALWGGTALIVVPLSLGLINYQFFADVHDGWLLFHEIGTVVAGLAMLAMGVSCRIRATTYGGAWLAAAFVMSLATLIRVPAVLQNVALVMMLAGGALFGLAVLMSLYRDRVMSLPDRIQKGEGVFQVLKWR